MITHFEQLNADISDKYDQLKSGAGLAMNKLSDYVKETEVTFSMWKEAIAHKMDDSKLNVDKELEALEVHYKSGIETSAFSLFRNLNSPQSRPWNSCFFRSVKRPQAERG